MSASAIDLIRHMLPHVAVLGWGEAALWKGAQDMNMDPDMALLEVGTSVPHMIELFRDMIINDIQAIQPATALMSLPIRERMLTLIMTHFQQGALHKQAISKTLAFLKNPLNAPLMISFACHIVEALWRQAGDKSTEFNYYTKRLILGKIYVATLLYWLKDESENFEKTRVFLEKQLDFVLKIPHLKQKIKGLWGFKNQK